MKMNNFIKKLLSVVLCAAMMFVTFGAVTPKIYAQTLSGLKSEQSEIKEKISKSEDEIEELEKQQAEQSKIVDALNSQINELNKELENVHAQQSIINSDIKTTQNKITSLNNEIADLDNQIAQKDAEIEQTIQVFCQRLRANYMAGGTSTLEMFTASSGLANFLNRMEMFKRVTDSDQQLVDNLNKEIKSIQKMQEELREKQNKLKDEKTVLEGKKSDLQVSENQLSSTQAEIIAKSKEVNAKLKALNYQSKKLEVSIDEYNAEMDRVEAEIDAYMKAQSKKKSSSGNTSGYAGSVSSNISSSGWAWPLPYSGSYITSPYGYRSDPISGAYKFHSGIDISMASAYGKKLVATKAGTVSLVRHTSSGYGNYVIIDHGNGWASLYGHCSSTAVSVGQTVSQGQVVAYVGTSGYSTGPHVHFEIRYNGEKLNPSNYVSK